MNRLHEMPSPSRLVRYAELIFHRAESIVAQDRWRLKIGERRRLRSHFSSR